MKVIDLRAERNQVKVRVFATLIWEQSKLPSKDIYIEVPAAYGDRISCNPDAFLVACAMPAMYYGEERILVEGEVCPELQEGLKTAFGWIHHWFKVGNPNLRFDTKTRRRVANLPSQTASFFTGGVDSWANLLLNREAYAPEHPRFIRDCFMVHGLQRVKLESFERAFEEISQLGPQVQARFIPVYTNIYGHLIDADEAVNYRFWKTAYNGAALAAVAHIFSDCYSDISIASSLDIPSLVPLGTHPSLDLCFSSHNLRVHHDYITYTRFEKTQLIAKSEVALNNLRVCDAPELPANSHNCGYCEKCIRTVTALEAIGALQKTEAFPYQRLTPRLLSIACYLKDSGLVTIYGPMIPLLEKQGRGDLAAVLRSKITRFRLETIDKTYFKGAIFTILTKIKALLKRPSKVEAAKKAMGSF